MSKRSFYREPQPLRNEPPLKVTSRDVGKQIGTEGQPEILEILVRSIPPDATIEDAEYIATRALSEQLQGE